MRAVLLSPDSQDGPFLFAIPKFPVKSLISMHFSQFFDCDLCELWPHLSTGLLHRRSFEKGIL